MSFQPGAHERLGITDRFLAPALRASDDETKRRARLLVIVASLMLVNNIIFDALLVTTKQWGTLWQTSIPIGVVLVAVLVLIRRGHLRVATHVACGGYILLLFKLSFSVGGIFSIGLWIYSVFAVMLAFFLGGKRVGGLWASVHLGGVAVHVVLLAMGVHLRAPPPADASAATAVIAIVTLTAIFIGIAVAYEGTKERMLNAVQDRTRRARLILDTIGEGYVFVNVDGTMSDERSKAVDALLGTPAPGIRVWDYLGGTVAERMTFRLSWEALIEDVLPQEMLMAQLPAQHVMAGRTFALTYRPVNSGALNGVVLLMHDVTAERMADRAREERIEQAEMFHHVVTDPTGFMAFVRESRELIEHMRVSRGTEFARALHTLKGNAALIGAMRLAGTCHAFEDRLQEGEEPSVQMPARLASDMNALATCFDAILPDCMQSTRVSDQDIETIRRAIAHSPSEDSVREILARWRPSSVERDLARVADKARRLAARLGKPDVAVRVECEAIDVPNGALDALWVTFGHLVRNALDHGIDGNAGTVTLAARAEGDEIVAYVRDDGRGVDWESVRVKARAAGLAADTREDLTEALCSDGFTTNDRASLESGRGLGLGAVREVARQLGGTLFLTAERGAGTTVGVRIPLHVVRQREAA